MDELFKAVRSSCSPGTWSKAVELVRRFSVTGERADDEEIVCRVKETGRVVPRTVQLYPDDEEWACDCESRAPCCEHVAAAVIAVRKARAEGQELPVGRSHDAKMVYRFSRYRGELSLERVIIKQDGSEVPLDKTLASAVATKNMGVELTPSQSDLMVDRVLAQRVRGPLPPEQCVSVIKLLASARNVELDGTSVHVGTEQFKPRAKITATKAGYLVELAADPRITEVVASGVALAGDTLHLLADTDATGAKLEKLPDRKEYPKSAGLTLVTEVLPAMLQRFEVDTSEAKLPKITREAKPRAVVEAEQQGDRLTAMLTLVYGDPPLARVDGGRLVHLGGDIPMRDEKQERRVLARAKEALGMSPGVRIFTEGDAATDLAARLDAFAGEVRGSQGKSFIRRTQLEATLERGAGGLGVKFVGQGELLSEAGGETTRWAAGSGGGRDGVSEGGRAEGGMLEASAEAVARAWAEGHSLVPLLGGGWAPLPTEWLAQHANLLQQVLQARDQQRDGELPAHAAPALLELCEALDTPPPAELEPFRALLRGLEHLPEAKLPEGLQADLRAYQRRGVNWLSFMRDARMGAILADDMGLGKTLQTLCILKGRCLVVCPTSVVHNWAAELSKFRPDLSYSVYHGKNRELDPDVAVTLTSYAIARLDQELLTAVDWEIIVLDEAQTIKNPESQVAQAAYSLRARFKLTLTGTPVENRLDELWSQFHFTNPGLLGGRSQFVAECADPIAEGRAGAAAALRKRIAPFLLRRDKRTVAPELPPRTDIVLHCELGERERELYDALAAATRKEVVERLREGGNVMQALEALLRLRQAACHPSLIPGQLADSSAKLERLLESLIEAAADGHRALVFSQWTSLLDLVEPKLDAAAIRYGRLDGSTRDRQGVVEEFQSEGGPEVLLLSLKAGGTGLNLTAADHVFLLDPWWNPAVEEQAADRAHRIGQDRPVFVHRLVARNTVEERILELQKHKRGIAAAALEDAEKAASLTRDDLLMLLE